MISPADTTITSDHPAPHLRAAGAALLLAVGLLMTVQLYVARRLPASMPAFASRTSPIKLTGNVLQTEAFRIPDSLPIYGSSELDRRADNRPDAFFRGAPTGFTAFPIGRGGTTCLMILQKLAAAGPAVRDHRTVVFLSPTWFAKEGVSKTAVAANLTPTLLGGWIFNSALSLPLKTEIARRLRDYPGSLEKQPLLAAAVDCLSDPTPFHRFLLAAITPAGRAQNGILQWVEYGAILREMITYGKKEARHRGDKNTGVTAPPTSQPDWPNLAQTAEAQDRARNQATIFSAINVPHFNGIRERKIRARAVGSRDEEFVAHLEQSREWNDLALLIRGLKELHADTLFISQPYNGIYRDTGGTSPQSRKVYYTKLEDTLRAAGYPLLDFSEHEEDRFFFNDTGHPSAKAWIFYDEGIDKFYHQKQG